jgi:hypothetical protein
MRQARLVTIVSALFVAAGSASAQQVPLPMQPAPAGPYKSAQAAGKRDRNEVLRSVTSIRLASPTALLAAITVQLSN